MNQHKKVDGGYLVNQEPNEPYIVRFVERIDGKPYFLELCPEKLRLTQLNSEEKEGI